MLSTEDLDRLKAIELYLRDFKAEPSVEKTEEDLEWAIHKLSELLLKQGEFFCPNCSCVICTKLQINERAS